MSEAEKQEYNELLSRLVYDYHTAVNYLMLDIEQELACKRVLRLTPKGIEAARALSENK